MKTLMTRIGEGSKMVALGDISQIDASWLDKENNGLSHILDKGRETALVGIVALQKSHRSTLADWASENL